MPVNELSAWFSFQLIARGGESRQAGQSYFDLKCFGFDINLYGFIIGYTCYLQYWACNIFGIIFVLGEELSLVAFVEKVFCISDRQKQKGEV